MRCLRLAQAVDVSLLKTMLQEFAAFERLPVTVTEADLLCDVQIHLPVNVCSREAQIRGARKLFKLEKR